MTSRIPCSASSQARSGRARSERLPHRWPAIPARRDVPERCGRTPCIAHPQSGTPSLLVQSEECQSATASRCDAAQPASDYPDSTKAPERTRYGQRVSACGGMHAHRTGSLASDLAVLACSSALLAKMARPAASLPVGVSRSLGGAVRSLARDSKSADRVARSNGRAVQSNGHASRSHDAAPRSVSARCSLPPLFTPKQSLLLHAVNSYHHLGA